MLDVKDWQGLLIRSSLKVRQCGALMKAEADARLSGFKFCYLLPVLCNLRQSSVPLFSHL